MLRQIHGNSQEVLQKLLAGGLRVDAIITDMPYANDTDYDGYKDNQENLKVIIDWFMPLAFQIAKRTAIFCGVGNMWLYPKPDWVLSWTAPAGVGSSRWGFSCWQPILVYGEDPYLKDGKAGRRPDTIVGNFPPPKRVDHPCPKPERVMNWLVERMFAKPGGWVIDPFMGSGSTLVACWLMGRNCIGIDQSRKYYEESIRRTSVLQTAPPLFTSIEETLHDQSIW